MTTTGPADRYLALCELAMCSPDTPDLLAPCEPAAWLQARLAQRGQGVPFAEVLNCHARWRERNAATPGVTIMDVSLEDSP